MIRRGPEVGIERVPSPRQLQPTAGEERGVIRQ